MNKEELEKQLRLGNLVYLKNEDPYQEQEWDVTSVDSLPLPLIRSYVKHDPTISSALTLGATWKPIPLTEEWLERFGFEYSKESGLWIKKDFAIRFLHKESLVYRFLAPMNEESKYYCILGCVVCYVHELQNAYPVLMRGKELELI